MVLVVTVVVIVVAVVVVLVVVVVAARSTWLLAAEVTEPNGFFAVTLMDRSPLVTSNSTSLCIMPFSVAAGVATLMNLFDSTPSMLASKVYS